MKIEDDTYYMAKTVYKTKIGIGIIFFILLVNGFIVYQIQELLGSILISLFMLLIIASIINIHYVIEDGKLFVKQFKFNMTKPIDIISIQTIEKRRSIISSPAGSTERLELRCGKLGTLTISPKNEEAFVQQLMSINPLIKYIDKD